MGLFVRFPDFYNMECIPVYIVHVFQVDHKPFLAASFLGLLIYFLQPQAAVRQDGIKGFFLFGADESPPFDDYNSHPGLGGCFNRWISGVHFCAYRLHIW